MHRSARQLRRQRRGLTLIECMVASLLLALGASAVMVAISAGLQHQEFAAEQRVGTQLGQQLLEEVSARTYLHPDNPSFSTLEPSSAQAMDGYTDEVDSVGDAATGDGSYRRKVIISSAADAGIAGIPGAGVAVAEVTTPSGQKLRLTRLLPAQ